MISSKGVWFAAMAACAIAATSTCRAEVGPSTSASVGTGAPGLIALADQELIEVRGGGVDKDVLRQLGQGELKKSEQEARNGSRSATAQNTAALLAALELQARQGQQAATTAVNAVNTAAQLSGTLIALTPVVSLVPIGLPLFGLSTLPSHSSGH